MEHLPVKRGRALPDDRTPSEIARDEWIANRAKASTPPAKPVVRKPRTPAPKATWEQQKAAADQKVKQAQSKAENIKRQSSAKTHAANEKLLKNTPAFREHQHPRDRFGRFAVKAVKATGRAIGHTAKGVGKVARGTAKVVKSAHRTVKRVNADMRRRDALAHRERKLDLHNREVAAGLKRSRTARRKKAAPAKKQGGLFGFLGSPQKKQVRRRKS